MTLKQAIRELIANAGESVTDGELLDMIQQELEKRLEAAMYQRKITTTPISAYEYDIEIGAINRRLELLKYKLKASP